MNKKITIKVLVFWSLIISSLFSFQNSNGQVCTGTPVPGNTISSALSPCPGIAFTLSVQNSATLGTGISYQWLMGGSAIPGATNSTYTGVLVASSATYSCEVTCLTSGLTASSTPVTLVTSTILSCYCLSSATAVQDEEIYNVTLNGNSTNTLYSYGNGCTNTAPGPGSVLSKYSSFLSLAPLANCNQGATSTFTIVQDECDGPTYFSNRIGVWIDYNQNASFTDPGEEIYLETTSTIGPRTVTGVFTVPFTAIMGTTVMRIVCREGGTPSPCGTYPYGETEDYLIGINTAALCAGTPNPGNTLASSSIICSGGLTNFSLQNLIVPSVGISYQWYNTSGLITGANSLTYSANLTASDSFYCIVTCVPSGMSTISTPVYVQVLPPIVATSTDTACNIYYWNSNLLTASGTYTATFATVSGCDSIHTLNLTILQSSSSAVTLSGCDSVVHNGITYSSTGMYTQNYVNAVGCDSVLTIYATVNYTTDSTIIQTGCDFYTFNSTVYSTSGIYTHTFMSASGCDSTIHLDLTMNQSTDSVINSLSCNAFTLNGLTYTNTGNYTQSLLNASGCDSTILLQLTIDTLQAIITASGTGLSTPSGGSFQWFDCSTNTIIPGATSLNFTPSSGGSYAVIVTTSTCVDTSICVNVWATNTEDLNSDKDITIYPNPSLGIFELGLSKPAEIILVSSIGEIVLQEKFLKGKHSLNISSYASGVYFLKVKSNEKLVTYKLIKE